VSLEPSIGTELPQLDIDDVESKDGPGDKVDEPGSPVEHQFSIFF